MFYWLFLGTSYIIPGCKDFLPIFSSKIFIVLNGLFCKCQLDPVSWWCFSFGLACLWSRFEFIGLCLLPNLGSFQQLFLQMFVQHYALSPVLLGLWWWYAYWKFCCPIGSWGFVHIFFVLVRLDYFCHPVLKFTDFPLCVSYPFFYWFHPLRY